MSVWVASAMMDGNAYVWVFYTKPTLESAQAQAFKDLGSAAEELFRWSISEELVLP